MMKRLFVIFVLVLFVGPMFLGLGYLLMPGLRYHAFTIIALIYLLFTIVELFRISYNVLRLFSKAKARLEGGWAFRIKSALASSEAGRIKRLMRNIALCFGIVADSLAWPSSLIPRLYFKISSEELFKNNVRKTISKIAIASTTTLCWQTGVMLSISVMSFYAVVFLTPHDHTGDFLFWIFIVYANFFLLSAAISSRSLAIRLRQQPLNPWIQLGLLIVFLGGLYVFSFGGLSLNSNISSIEALKSVFMNFAETADIWNLFARQSWSIEEFWLTFSSILFSIVLVKLLLRKKELSRSDNDYFVIASQYLEHQDAESADKWLSFVHNHNKDTLIACAIIDYLFDNKLKAKEHIRQSVLLQMHDWPNSPEESDIVWLETAMHIGSPSMPDNYVTESMNGFLAVEQRPLAYIGIADSLFLTGRMGWSKVYKTHEEIFSSPRTRLLQAYLLLAQGKHSESCIAIDYEHPAFYVSADLGLFYMLKLVINVSLHSLENKKREYIHKWCQEYTTACEEAVSGCIRENDVLGAISLKGNLDIVFLILKPFAPHDAKIIEDASMNINGFLKKYDLGRIALKIIPVAQKEAVNMPQHGLP
jgi:hypothetical protein